jgi:hypothetical protein
VRFGRPAIRIDPWSPNGPELELPPVARYLGAFWRVQADKTPVRVEASLHETRRLALQPARSWDVELHHNSAVLRGWAFEGLDPESALALFFDADDGSLFPLAATLRAESALVLRPETVNVRGVTVDGNEIEPRTLEELPRPGGDWSGYVLTRIDLAGLRAVSIEGEGSRPRRITIRPPAERPRLVGDGLDRVETDRGLAVYSRLPELVLPHDSEQEEYWAIRLGVDDESRALAIGELERGEHGLLIDSVIPIGEITEIDLVVNGPLGSDLRESFVVVPGLEVTRPRQLLLPGESGNGASPFGWASCRRRRAERDARPADSHWSRSGRLRHH